MDGGSKAHPKVYRLQKQVWPGSASQCAVGILLPLIGVYRCEYNDMTSPSEKIGSINVTPLIDILLVLLIIFMVITPLSLHGILAELPQTAVGVSSLPEPEIILEITRDHEFLLNGRMVQRGELPAEIAKLYKNRANQQLFIRADRDLDFREVALAMDAMRGADDSV